MSKSVKLALCCIVLLSIVTTARAYEGYAPLTTGGDGGTVVMVTSLADSGVGTLRAALDGLTGAPTIIKFNVGGTIRTTDRLRLIKPNVTIAGETAPAPGITIDGTNNINGTPTFVLYTNDAIVRHLRVRNNGGARETFQISGGSNLIVDHCSASGSLDGAMDINNGTNHITVSRCIIANSVEGHRSYGDYASLHHNFYYGNNRRQPKIVDYTGPYDFRNNVLQYWTGSGTNVAAGHQVNIINNYYGPTDKACASGFNIDPSLSSNVYINGNYFTCGTDINGLGDKPTPNEEPGVTTSPANDALRDNVKGDCGALPRDEYDYNIAGPALPQNQPPQVDAGLNRTIVNPTNSVNLDGTVTDDGLPNPPAAVTTTWTKTSGPGTVTFGNASAVDTTATFSAYGTYVLRLTADDSQLSLYDEVTITYSETPPQNQAPVVDAGPDQSVNTITDAVLDGTVSDDGLPYPPATVTALWTKQSGPGTVTFGNVNAVDTTANFSAVGVYVLRLTADDSALQSYDELTVTVTAGQNWSETADYYVDGLTGDDSSAGTSGAPWATMTKAVSAATAGKKVLVWGNQTYVVGKLIFSNSGTSASPITFKSDPASNRAVLDGNAIDDGTLYTISASYIVIDNFRITNGGTYGVQIYGDTADGWTIKNCRVTGNASHGIYIRAGDNTSIFNNIVYDNGGNFDGIYVYNSATTCNITQCSVYGHRYGIHYNLSSSGAIKDSIVTDAIYGIYNDGSTVTVTYSDVWNNSTNYTGVTPGTGCISADPMWANPDAEEFELLTGSPCIGTASDGGDMGYRTTPLTGNQAPVVNAGTDQQITLPASANLDGTVTDDGLPNPPAAVTTTWTKQSGPGTVTFGNASAVDTTASFSASGTYVLRLTASDSALSSYDEVAITVNPALPGWSETADYYVAGTTGSDSNPGSSSAPWATLTKAVSTATSGKKVLVWGGQTYTAALTFNNSGTSASPITFKRDPSSGTATINGNGTTTGTLYTLKADYVVIDGFTLTNGRYGVYIYGDGADNWTVKNCRITGNSYHGVYIRSGDNHLCFNDAIYGNGTAYYGVYLYSTALNNDVTQCDIYKHKYGIYYAAGCNAGNVLNSIITNATSYGIRGAATDVSVTYSDVWGNGTNYYGGVTAGTGCISANPLYVSPDTGDFHLQAGSPCDNTGSDGGDMGYRYSSSAL